MENSDKRELAQLLVMAGEVYDKKISEPFIKIYFEVLKGYLIEEVRRAIQLHMGDPESGKYFPRPADIVRQIEGDSESIALRAFHEVRTAMAKHGRDSSVRFADPAIMIALNEMGGWIWFSDVTEDAIPFVQREFCRRYLFARKHPARVPSHLPGLVEKSNCMKFDNWTPEIVSIGQGQDKLSKIGGAA